LIEDNKMAKQVINSGTIANDGTGDTLRAAADKINSNFTEVYDAVDAIQQVNSDWTATSGVTEILNKPVLFSGVYTDLTAIPVFADVATTGSYVDLSDQPHLSSVAISGSYADLSNKPALFSGSYSDLTNKPTLFSGSYSDLTSKPTIPNNTTQLRNGNNWITLSSVTWANLLNKPSFADVATSGSYADLTNKPTIPLAYSLPTASTSILGGVKVDGTTILINNGVISSVGSGGGTILPADAAGYLKNNGTGTLSWGTLATVATSGSYTDLTSKPTLFSGAYADLTGKPTIPDAQLQSDWNQTTVGALDYIKNKPAIPATLQALGIADGTPGQVLTDRKSVV
jgi:hypothetical protein